MAIRCACFCVIAVLQLPGVFSNGFLAASPRAQLVGQVRDEIRNAVADVLGMGHGISGARIGEIRGALSPLFRSLPKTRKGRLSPAIMRYAVQRYFRQHRGWIMKGFEAHAAQNASLAHDAQILQSHVPNFVRTVLEEKLSHDGFAFEDAVVMLATLERLVTVDVVLGVERAYFLNDIPTSSVLSPQSIKEVFSSYFIHEMLQLSSLNATAHMAKKARIRKIYPHWDEASVWLDDMMLNDVHEHQHSRSPFAKKGFVFEDVVRIAQRVAEEFGPFSHHECDTMKSALVAMDPQETGRVKISDFYGKSKGGAWQFEEGIGYLRESGALDESSPRLGAQVIIPNYIAGVNNCITSKAYYSICCMDACGSIYEHLEAAIPAASASVTEIVDVVNGMVPLLRDARNLSTALRTRLEDVAALHDGKVPLHGRLIAQWLHFVFPRECPYPHMVGSINPQSATQYEMANGKGSSDTTDEEMELFFKAESASIAPSPEAGLLMWNLNEVLLETATPSDAGESRTGPSFLHFVALLGMLGGLVMFVVKESRGIWDLLRTDEKPVEYVV